MSDAAKASAFHCEVCKLSYASQSELREHLWSLMHHVRLEQKEKPPEHVCCLCQASSNNLVQYGQHLNELKHKKALTKLREKKISESTKPSSLLSLKTPVPPFLMPNKSWHLSYPFSHLKPYISPLNSRKHLPQPYQRYPPGTGNGDQYGRGNLMRAGVHFNEERSFNCNENNSVDHSGQPYQRYGGQPYHGDQYVRGNPMRAGVHFNEERSFNCNENNSIVHGGQPYQRYPLGVGHGDQYGRGNPMRAGVHLIEERISLNCNENNSGVHGGDTDVAMVDQEFLKVHPVKQNEVSVGKKNVVMKKKKIKKDKVDVPSSSSTNDQSLVKDSKQSLCRSVLAPRSKKKMVVTTPSGFRQGLFLEEDFQKNNLDIVRLNLINATTDKGDKVFTNKLTAGFMKDNNNSSQHSSLSRVQTKDFRSSKLTTKNRSLKTSNTTKKHLKPLQLSPLKVPSKAQPESVSKAVPSKVTKPVEAVKDDQDNKSKALNQNSFSVYQMETEPKDKTVKVQSENLLRLLPVPSDARETSKDSHNPPSIPSEAVETTKNSNNSPSIVSDAVQTPQNSKYSPNIPSDAVEISENSNNSPKIPCVIVEATKNSKNLETCNSLSQSSENSGPIIIKSADSKESDSKSTKSMETKPNSSSSSIDITTCKPTGSLSETAVSGAARKRTLSSEYLAGSGKPNLLKKLKCSTSKEMSISEKNQNLNPDAAKNSAKKVETASNYSTVSSLQERSNHSEEIIPTKPDSANVEKQQLSKNVGKEELVKMTKLSCLNHKEKMHLSSVMKSYTKTQNKRSAVPRLTMQLSSIYNSTNQKENNEKLNLPEGLEEQITMLIKKENMDELGNTETFSNSDQLMTKTSQANIQMDLVPTTVSDPLQPLFNLDQSNFSSASTKSSVSAGNKKSTKKSLSKNALQAPPSSCATICTPTTTTNTAISTITTTTSTTATTAAASNSSKIVDQNVAGENTVEPNSQTSDVFNQVYLLTLREEEVCGNISNLNQRISYLEKLIEDSKIALQACKDEQLGLMEEEQNIRKMRIGILKEAMGDTNRSNSELINHLLRSHLASEGTHQNISAPPESCNEQTFGMQHDGTTAQETCRPAAMLENTGILTTAQQKQPTLAALLAKGKQTESAFNKLQTNCPAQGTRPPQPGSVTQETLHQSSSQNNYMANLLLTKDVTKGLKLPKALKDSVFKNQKAVSDMLKLQESSQGIFSQVGINTLQLPDVPNNTSSGKKGLKGSIFQYNQKDPLLSTEERNILNSSKSPHFSFPPQQHSNFKAPSSVSSSSSSSSKITNSDNNNASDSVNMQANIMDLSKKVSEISHSLTCVKKENDGNCESEASVEPTTLPVTSTFDNVQIKTEPMSPEAIETNPPVSDSGFNFVSIKEEPKSPTDFGGFGLDELNQDSSSAFSQIDNQQKVNCFEKGQPHLFSESSVGEVGSNTGNPVSPENRLVNTCKSESNLPVTSPILEVATTTCVQQSATSLQSTTSSNHSAKPNSIPASHNGKEKSDEELEFFSSLSMKNLLDSSCIENVDPEKCSGNVSMKYLGSMSNNLVEQLKECWKKQNVTMNKCFPQGQTDDTVPVANVSTLPPFTSTCETSMRTENHLTPSQIAKPSPYIINVDESNNFVLPASLNPVVSIKPLSLSSKNNSSGSKYIESVDVNAAKSNSKLSETISNNEQSSDELPIDDSSISVIVIDGDSSSEDNGADKTVNKLPSSAAPRQVLNTIPEGSSTDTLQNQFSTKSQENVSDSVSTTNTVFKGPNCPVTNCAIFGNYLYVSYQGHSPQKFDLKTAICVKEYDCQPFSVQCMLVTGFSFENPRVFSGGASEMLLVFNEITGQLLTKIDLMRKIYTFHEKWNYLFVGLADGGVSKINLKTLKEISNISYGTKPIHCLATCTEGALKILCVGAYDASILIVSASSGLLLKTLLPCQRLLYSIKVSQNLIYSCSEDRKLAVFDIETGDLLKCIQGHSGTVSCLYVDNKILVTGSHDKLINVYWGSVTDLDKIKPFSFYGAGKQSISCLTVSDRKIYSGNFYGLVEAFDIPSSSSPKEWICRYNKCTLTFGLYEDLKFHLHSEHLKGQIAKWNNWQCHWVFCSETFESLSLLMKHCDRHLKQ